jgi:hypothetical protein
MALLSALEQVIGRQTGRKSTGAALTAALQSYVTSS